MFEASDAESVEWLQISCHGFVTVQGPVRVAVRGVRMPRLNFFVPGAGRSIFEATFEKPIEIIRRPSFCWTCHF